MARKRMITPAIWEDPTFNKLSTGARLLFIGMISNADDEGYIRADKGSLKRLVFGFDENVPDLTSWISEMQFQKNLHFYDIEGEMYAHFLKWDIHQKQQKDRIQPSIYPSCSRCVADDKQVLKEVKLSKSGQGKLSQVKKDLGVEKTETPKKEHKVQEVVNYLAELKGWTTDSKKDFIFSRHVKPAKDLLILCDDDVGEAKECLRKIAEWAKSRDLEWSIETVFKKWYELDLLKPKEKKPYWDNCRIFQKSQGGKWWIIRNGEIKELGRELSPQEIAWK